MRPSLTCSRERTAGTKMENLISVLCQRDQIMLSTYRAGRLAGSAPTTIPYHARTPVLTPMCVTVTGLWVQGLKLSRLLRDAVQDPGETKPLLEWDAARQRNWRKLGVLPALLLPLKRVPVVQMRALPAMRLTGAINFWGVSSRRLTVLWAAQRAAATERRSGGRRSGGASFRAAAVVARTAARGDC